MSRLRIPFAATVAVLSIAASDAPAKNIADISATPVTVNRFPNKAADARSELTAHKLNGMERLKVKTFGANTPAE